MSTSLHSGEPPNRRVSDKQDLDELMKDAKPFGNGGAWSIPGFFESDAEQAEFVAWVRAERNRGCLSETPE